MMYRKFRSGIFDMECIEKRQESRVLKEETTLNMQERKAMDFCDSCGELIERLNNVIVSGQKPAANECASCSKEHHETQTKGRSTGAQTIPKEGQVVDEAIQLQWEEEQQNIKKQRIDKDCDDWSKNLITVENQDEFPGQRPLEYIGGVDISFVKGDDVNACAAFVVLRFPDLEVVYEDLSMVQLTAPYIPGYLAFREADFLVNKIEDLRKKKPEVLPQVIMVDGNGILHPRRCGLAVHLGVLVDIPCMGVAKNLYFVDGLEKNDEHMEKIRSLKQGGDTFPLETNDGEILGMAVRSHDGAPNPVFVSAGHKISLETSIWLTKKCCQKRVPEPTRQADIRSREYLRKHFLPPDERQQKKQKKKKEKPPKTVDDEKT